MGCFSRMARLARASRFCDQAKPSWTFRRSVHRQISEDSWFLCALCNKNCCSWSRAGSYPLSRVKKYRPSRLSINVSCCCYYYYVRSQVLPVELRCGGAERACLAMNTGRRHMMILSRGHEFTLPTGHDPFSSWTPWGTSLSGQPSSTWNVLPFNLQSWKNLVAHRFSPYECQKCAVESRW